MSRVTFHSRSIPAGAQVAAFRGEEAISEPYRFDVHLFIPDNDGSAIDWDAIVGTPATLTLAPSAKSPASEERSYHGHVSEIELVHAQDGWLLLTATLLPELANLTQSHHSRMYTEQSVEDVINDVLGRAALATSFDVSLQGEHPVEKHICQARESDLAFLARWMEREGIFYFFDHEGEAESLTIADDKSTHPSCQDKAVRYHPVAEGDVSAGASLASLTAVGALIPSQVKLVDYDYSRPSLEVSATEAVSDVGIGQQVLHEARFFDPDDAKRLATLRAEEARAREHSYRAQGTVIGLRPGHTFKLDGHPDNGLNQDYVVIRASHHGVQDVQSAEIAELIGVEPAPGYRVEVEIIPAKVPFRPKSRTPWPRIHGLEIAVVDGSAGSDYAQLDDQGRYQVRMHFDESELDDGSASTWLRMMQPHAGAPEGFHFPLRKGTEVAVAFAGGDPDRPIIAGVLPNAHNPSSVTKANHSQNVVQTGGKTRIEIEDEKDRQYIYVFTPPKKTQMNLGFPWKPTHNIVLRTDGDTLFDIGTNQDILVGGVLEEEVTGDVDETYKDTQTSTIDGKQDTKVGGDVAEYYLAKQNTTVKGGLRDEDFKAGQMTMAIGAREETYGGGQTSQTFGGTTETWIGGWTRTVKGVTDELYNGTLTEMATGAVAEIYPASMEEKYGDVVAMWANLSWISPAIKMNAPSWTTTTPLRTELKILDDKIEPVITGSDGVATGTTGFKKEKVGVSYGAIGAQIGITGASFSLSGPVMKTGLAEVDVAGFKIHVTGLSKK